MIELQKMQRSINTFDKLSCTLLILCLCAWSQQLLAQTVLKNAQIIDVRNGQIETRSLLIKGSKIINIEAFESLSVTDTDTVIDCEGKYIIPGLHDMHMHLVENDNTLPHLPKLLRHGITTVRDLGGKAQQVAEAKKQILRGEIAGPDIYFSGYTLDGDQSQDPFHYKVSEHTDIRALTEKLKQMNIDFFKVHNLFPREKLYELKNSARPSNLKIIGHIPIGIGLMELHEVGINGIEHINSLLSGLVLDPSNEINTLADALEALDAPFVVSMSNYFNQHDIALTPTMYAMNDMYSQLQGEEAQAKGRQLMNLFHDMLRWMNSHGVLLLAGTDRGRLNDDNLFELQDELTMMVESGLSPLDALKTATINAAIFLNTDQTHGTIEVNKTANLVILNSNPLQDIANTKDIHQVIKNGVVYKRSPAPVDT